MKKRILPFMVSFAALMPMSMCMQGFAATKTDSASVNTVPYVNEIEDDDEFGTLEVINANNDDCTWARDWHNVDVFDSYAYLSLWGATTDDWLVIPPLHLKANTTYEVKYSYRYQSSTPIKVAVKLGEKLDTTSFTTAVDEKELPGSWDYKWDNAVVKFTTTEEKDYRIGFQCVLDAIGYGEFDIDSLSVNEVGDVPQPQPEPVVYSNSFDARSDFDTLETIDGNGYGDKFEWDWNGFEDTPDGSWTRCYGYGSSMDQWLVIPNIELKKDVNYSLKYSYKGISVDFAVALGETLDATNFKTVSEAVLPETDDWADGVSSFVAPESKTYRVGLHCTKGSYYGYLYLDDLLLEESTPTGVKRVISLNALAVTQNADLIKLSKTCDEVSLFGLSGVRVFTGKKVSEISTTGMTPGLYILKASYGGSNVTTKLMVK